MLRPLFLLCSWTLLVSCNSARNEKVSYNFQVRPVLSDKCFTCHGPDANKREAHLRLDTKEGLFGLLNEPSERRVVIPGDPDMSELYRRIHDEGEDVMPPPASNLTLTDEEKELIGRWIEQGAEYEEHWSFIPPEKIPVDVTGSWARNEIDILIERQLDRKGLSPNPPADDDRLLKRLSIDLTGLPPSIEHQRRFRSGEISYEQVVDELLTSPHYGERMAIPWLDVARYADSHGYQDDGLRTMWPWRDWVIHAFNENYPYDKFVRMQLAGDLFDDPTKEDLLATGFNRNHKITQEGGVIDEEYRVEYVTDRTNTFGKAFLGLTMECAKCHDHKYDPISMEEYYGTFAFFDKVPEKGLFGDISVASLADPPFMEITDQDVEGMLSFIQKLDTGNVRVMVMKDSTDLRETYVLERGVYDAKGKIVNATTPSAVLQYDSMKYAADRVGLADWLLSEDNPLASRVFVNRIWMQYFGKGIVATPGDFGLQGAIPTHPELLDWLAVDFRENGWDIKRLVRQIVTSAAYRQSSVITGEHRRKDPDNLFYARMSRKRYDAEIIRDHALATSGLLNPVIGGPSVKPYQPDGLWDAATSGRGILKKYRQDHGQDLYRRGMYTFIKRTVPPPSMLLFDASNRDQCEVKRHVTNTPLQALVMLNDPTILEASRVFAEKLVSSEESDPIGYAFMKIICREISDDERKVIETYFGEERTSLEADRERAIAMIGVGEYPIDDTLEPVEVAALMQTILLIYNMEEATTKS